MLHINIDTSNAAFSDGNYGYEVKRILSTITGESGQKLRDINGNTVGEVSRTTEAERDMRMLLIKLERLFKYNDIDRNTRKGFDCFFDKYNI